MYYNSLLFGAAVGQNCPDCAEHNAKIKAERPVLNVVKVEGAAFIKTDVAAAGDLSEAGQPRFHRQK